MQDFCDDLRRERELRQVSLETMSQVTKFSQRHLLALEQGQMTSLPGGVFRKGILRSYLSALALDPAPWVIRFDQCLAEVGTPTETPESLAAFAENVRRGRGASAGEPSRWPGVFVLLLMLIAFGWCVWRFALRDHVVLTHLMQPRTTDSSGRLPPG